MTVRSSPREREVFGVDIHSGDVRGTSPTYALVVVSGNDIERDRVSARKLHRLIAQKAPSIVATDNVFELASDKEDLVHLLRAIPAETTLVQVTGDERPEPLSRVAHRHDVTYDSSPMGEAEAAARLAAKNVGCAVRAHEQTTILRVTRGRSPGKGGSSEDRYTRRIHGAVKQRAREVTKTLEDAEIPFEREVTEKYGGWSRAEFTVEATPDAIPISRERSSDVRIEIEPVRADGLEFVPLKNGRGPVIVGVDPGTVTGVGIVDLEGTVQDVWSSRTSDLGDVVEWIVERGRPLIVAADVPNMPNTVDQIRRSFDAVGWTPADDIPVDEKLHRTPTARIDSDHERDALAAALFAYDDHQHQFQRIDRKTPPGVEWTGVARRVLKDGVPVEAVLEQDDDEAEPDEEPAMEAVPEQTEEQRRITALEARVERLQRHNEELETELASRADTIDRLEEQLRQVRTQERRAVRRERAVTRLERERDRLQRELQAAQSTIDDLEAKVGRMKTLWRLDHSDFATVEERQSDLVPVKPIEKFTVSALEEADERFGLARDEVLYLRDATGAGEAAARELAKLEPRIVLLSGGLTDIADRILWEAEVPTGPADAVTIQEVDELAVARESEVETAIERWHDRAETRRRERKRQLVDDLIDEHRRERAS